MANSVFNFYEWTQQHDLTMDTQQALVIDGYNVKFALLGMTEQEIHELNISKGQKAALRCALNDLKRRAEAPIDRDVNAMQSEMDDLRIVVSNSQERSANPEQYMAFHHWHTLVNRAVPPIEIPEISYALNCPQDVELQQAEPLSPEQNLLVVPFPRSRAASSSSCPSSAGAAYPNQFWSGETDASLAQLTQLAQQLGSLLEHLNSSSVDMSYVRNCIQHTHDTLLTWPGRDLSEAISSSASDCCNSDGIICNRPCIRNQRRYTVPAFEKALAQKKKKHNIHCKTYRDKKKRERMELEKRLELLLQERQHYHVTSTSVQQINHQATAKNHWPSSRGNARSVEHSTETGTQTIADRTITPDPERLPPSPSTYTHLAANTAKLVMTNQHRSGLAASKFSWNDFASDTTSSDEDQLSDVEQNCNATAATDSTGLMVVYNTATCPVARTQRLRLRPHGKHVSDSVSKELLNCAEDYGSLWLHKKHLDVPERESDMVQHIFILLLAAIIFLIWRRCRLFEF